MKRKLKKKKRRKSKLAIGKRIYLIILEVKEERMMSRGMGRATDATTHPLSIYTQAISEPVSLASSSTSTVDTSEV